ncbi:MAG: PaaI family thioesterase [Porticoccaceae bacterium]
MNIVELVRQAKASNDFGVLSEGIPYMKTLSISVSERQGLLTTQLDADTLHTGNPWLPALHGGVIGGLLETAAILQLCHDQETDNLPKPINITVDYLRSGRIVPTYSEAVVTKHGRRVANVQATCWQDDKNKPIATLFGHFLMS